jgi:sRNA-binding carbon storage regulator CsrA
VKIVTLKRSETVRIGDTLVTFRRKRGEKGFELDINAPPLKPVYREEVYAFLKKDEALRSTQNANKQLLF